VSISTLDRPPVVSQPFPDVVDRMIHGTISGPLSVECIVDGVGNVQSNLLETSNEFFLQLSLPGVDEDALRIQCEGRLVTVTGRFRIPTFDEAAAVWQSIVGGEFCEVFRLPWPVDCTVTTAHFDRGILTVSLAKAASFEFGPLD